MTFLWSPKHYAELVEWLAEYFEKPLETFVQMETDQVWAVYRKICPFDLPVGRWVSKEYH